MKTKPFKKFDEIASGNLHISVTGFVTGEKKESATVLGIDKAKEWLAQHGGYAAIKANYEGAQLTGWDIYRQYDGYGHRCCGQINEA